MRQKRIIQGLNNSQKIRVIVNGVGFYTTVMGMTQMCFTSQRVAVWTALERIAREKILGFAGRTSAYDGKMQRTEIDFQVDLITD
jgi:hypothetical protein